MFISLEEYDDLCCLYRNGRAPRFREREGNNEWLIDNINRYCGNIFLDVNNGTYRTNLKEKYHIKEDFSILDFGPNLDSFWNNVYTTGSDVDFLGVPKKKKDVHYIFNKYRKPVYMDFDINPRDLVICIERINEMSTEEKLIKLLNNVVDFSKEYIVIIAWAEEFEVDSDVESRKFYWDMDIYKWYILESGFMEKARICVPDYINMLYVFQKI